VDRGTAGLVGGTGLNRGGVGTSGNSNLENRNFGNRNLANSDLRNRNLVTGGLAGRNSFARNSLAGSNPTWRNGFDHTNFHRLGEGDRFGRFGDRDRFDRFNGSGNAFFGGFGGGWAGPVFWPYAYTDIYCGAFWDCGYGAPFWDYGYGDIYGAMFWPFAYDLLASYLPALTSGYGYGGYGGYGGAAYASNRYRHASRTYARSDTGALPSPDQRAQMCGQDTRDVVGLPSDQIQELISPTPDQQAALNDFINASVAAAQTIKSACPTAIPFTPTGRLEAMEQRMGAMAQAVSVLQGPLDRFWNTLSDEQKARLSTAGTAQDQQHAQQNTNGQRSVALGCNAATTATQWPGSLIEKAVHPDALQQAKLDALKQAGDQAADELANACPSELPSTPPDRLVAIGKRLEVMKRTVSSVRVALADFYRSLSDEQKAQFNTIGGQRTARRQG
jgi:hypothetical protein